MTQEIQKRESAADLWSDFDRWFDPLHGGLFDTWNLAPFATPWAAIESSDGPIFRAARTDVSDNGTSYRLTVEIPGIPKDKLDIRIKGSNVEIKGEATTEKEEKNGSAYVHRERSYAGFYRRLELPEPVVATEAKAKVENGLLELELPKEHPTAEVKIAVE